MSNSINLFLTQLVTKSLTTDVKFLSAFPCFNLTGAKDSSHRNQTAAHRGYGRFAWQDPWSIRSLLSLWRRRQSRVHQRCRTRRKSIFAFQTGTAAEPFSAWWGKGLAFQGVRHAPGCSPLEVQTSVWILLISF